uniref:Transmembrane protein 116 n=1 Tax=Varanus komodoensis TaxID=61221 RepID=A0A8D2JE53_VARKO
VVPTLGLGNHYECYQNFTVKHGCLLMHTEVAQSLGSRQPPCTAVYLYGLGVFLVSFLASFLTILVLLIRARALYKRFVSATGYVGDRQWAMIRMVEQGVVLYPTVFFCCWGPGMETGKAPPTCSCVRVCMMAGQGHTAVDMGQLSGGGGQRPRS